MEIRRQSGVRVTPKRPQTTQRANVRRVFARRHGHLGSPSPGPNSIAGRDEAERALISGHIQAPPRAVASSVRSLPLVPGYCYDA
ncbi:hypothetical protein MRX96_016266 [Rhipicephalus microplus]